MGLLLFYLFLALIISFLCSILEAVFLSVTPTYIASLDSQKKYKKKLKHLKENVDQSISSILILNTIAHTMGAVGVGAEAVLLFGIEWQSLIAVILTLLILYVSEIIPKTIGATYWRQLSRPTTLLIDFLVKFLYPLIWISSLITKKIGKNRTAGPTREEIVAMAELGEESGILEEKEEQFIVNLLQLKQVRVDDILTPRSVVYSLNAKRAIEDTLNENNTFIYSRIPVYENSNDNIIGVVFSRDILKLTSLDQQENLSLETITKPVFVVSENLPVYYLMDLFIKRKEHLFVVHDSYEQYVGIVTLEDAIETLLGVEIVDEADKVTDMQQLAREKAIHWKQNNKLPK